MRPAPGRLAVNKRVLYPLLVLAGSVLIALLIATNRQAVVPQPYQAIIPTVRVIEARTATEFLGVSSQGTVQPRTQSELIPGVRPGYADIALAG